MIEEIVHFELLLWTAPPPGEEILTTQESTGQSADRNDMTANSITRSQPRRMMTPQGMEK
jgi:hypothetical protein